MPAATVTCPPIPGFSIPLSILAAFKTPAIGVTLTTPSFSFTLQCPPCLTISLSLPTFSFSFGLPSFSLEFFLSLFFNFDICDLSVSFGINAGLAPPVLGGRTIAIVEDPSLDESLQVAA